MGIFSFLGSLLPARAPVAAGQAGRRPLPRPRLARHYGMNENSRLTGDWFSTGLTPDRAIYNNIATARSRAQEHERGDDMTRRFLTVMEMKVVGENGYTYQPTIGDFVAGKFVKDEMANRLLREAYKAAGRAGQYDVTGTMTRVEGQQMALRRLLVDGEVIKRYHPGWGNRSRFAVEFIDPARLDHMLNQEPGKDTNRITMGVELDANGAPVAYHFLPEARGVWEAQAWTGPHVRVEARYIRHVFVKERPNQRRGITWLAPTALRKHLLDGMEKAYVVACRVGASKMGFFRSEKGEEFEGEGVDANGNTIMDASPGSFEQLPDGVSLEKWDPAMPEGIPEAVKCLKQGISSGMGLSYHTLANDLEGVSFSSMRSGELTDRDFYALWQGRMIDQDTDPEFDAWLEMLLLAGAVNLPASKLEKFRSREFWGRSWMWVDPLKQHLAQLAQYQLGRTLESIHQENGWPENEVEPRTADQIFANPAFVAALAGAAGASTPPGPA